MVLSLHADKSDIIVPFPKTRQERVQMFCWLGGEGILFTWDVFCQGSVRERSQVAQLGRAVSPPSAKLVYECVDPRNTAPNFSHAYLSVETTDSRKLLKVVKEKIESMDEKDTLGQV